MTITLSKPDAKIYGDLSLSSSKSESNRLLLMSALSESLFDIQNLSDAKDTQTMQRLLSSGDKHWDVMEAGTTMRFCTAFLAMRGAGHVITGTERMKNRPIGLLVDALRSLGANIHYEEKEGFPPLRLTGIQDQHRDEIEIPGNISSQFISALLMVAPCLPRGLQITLTQEIFSRPYIEMTLKLMNHFGVKSEWNENVITVKPQSYQTATYVVESDWSGASYWYAMAVAADEAKIFLRGLRKASHQGDRQIVDIMKGFGIKTTFHPEGVEITKSGAPESFIDIDFRTCPDLAQGVMVAAALKGVSLKMTGLETLRIKETDRIQAMKNELSKINANLLEADGVWTLIPTNGEFATPTIKTYEDHRMAMAFAPVALVSALTIEEPEVTKKSYPGFWEDLRKVGFSIY